MLKKNLPFSITLLLAVTETGDYTECHGANCSERFLETVALSTENICLNNTYLWSTGLNIETLNPYPNM